MKVLPNTPKKPLVAASAGKWMSLMAGLAISGSMSAEVIPQFDPATGTLLPVDSPDDSNLPNPALENPALGNAPAEKEDELVKEPLDAEAKMQEREARADAFGQEAKPQDAAKEAEENLRPEMDAAADLEGQPIGIERVSGTPLEPAPLEPIPSANSYDALFPNGEAPPELVEGDAAEEEAEPAVTGFGRAGGFQGLGFAPPGALAAPIPMAPTGFSPYPVAVLPGAGDLLPGWGASASLSGVYNSNVQARSGALPGGDQGDFILSPNLSVTYRSPGQTLWYSVSANVGYSQYFDNTSYSGFNYGLSAAGGYAGAKLSVSGNLSLSYGSGGNRYYSSFVDELSIGLGLNANYKISSKTSVDASVSTTYRDPDAFISASTGDLNVSAGGRWQYSPKLSWGLGLSWTKSGGDTQVDRQTFGPYITASYTVTQKVSLNANFGLSQEKFSGVGGTDPSYNFSLGANYRANELWGMDLSLIGGTYPDGSRVGSYRDTIGARLGYNRSIGLNTWSLGVGWETSEQYRPGAFAGVTSDQDYLTFDTSLSRPLPLIRGSGSVFASWSDQNGGVASTYDNYTIGASISTSF